MNLRIRHIARRSEFRGVVLSETGVDPEEWDLPKYSDAAYAWMKKAFLSGEDGEKKWRKFEWQLWKGIDDPTPQKQGFDQTLSGLREVGMLRE